ncbi:TetR/AcrR family transcriptional regulator [Alkalihalobacillus sp. NPDC078783]
MSPKVSQAHKEKRRNEIIAAAKTVFIRKGFERTTMHDVVEESGMSRGGVYQYFSSTEEMMRALMDQGEEAFTGQKDRLYEKYETSWGVLEAIVEAHDTVPTDPIGLVNYEYFVAGFRDANKDRTLFLEKRLKNVRGFYVDVIEKGTAAGEFNPIQTPDVIASYIIILTDGLILHRNLGEEVETDIGGLIEGLKIYLRNALGIH